MPRGFVGRGDEVATIETRLDRLLEGEGALVLVAGDPGIGKTRLAEEALARAATRGAVTVWGRCWEAGGAPPYWPWAEALRALINSGEGAEHDHLADGALAQIVPAATDRHTPEPADDEGARFRLYEACTRLLAQVSSRQPVVVVLDDVHAADPSSLLLLQFVAARLAMMPVMIIVTYRDIELNAQHPFTESLGQMLRARSTHRVSLQGLEAPAVADLIAVTTGVSPSAAIARRVRDQTDGNPLYVSEMSRLLAAEGRLGEFEELSLPRDVRETVLQRVARLPAPTREALSTAAVLGREFPVDLLVAVSSGEVLEHLEPAAAANLIAPALRLGRLRFSHAVVAQAVYDEVPPGKRMQLHLAAATALVKRHEGDVEPVLTELAHHYCSAVPAAEPDVAVEFARRAGDRAVRLLAFEEGARLYRMAFSVLDGAAITAAEVRVDLLLLLGDALARAGEAADSRTALRQAAVLARATGDRVALARASLGHGGRFVWLRAGRDREIVPLLREALTGLPADDSILRVRVAARLAGALRDEPSRASRDALSLEALGMARRVGDRSTLISALTARFTAILGPDTVPELLALSAEAEQLAQGSDPEQEADARMLRYMALMTIGDIAGARVQVQAYEEIANALRQPSQLWGSGVIRSALALMTGPLHDVEPMLEETRSLGQTAQASDAEVAYRLGLLQLRREQARLREVEPLARESVPAFPGYRLFRAWHARILADIGDLGAARVIGKELLDGGENALPLDNGWLFGMAQLAETAIVLGDREMADRVYTALHPYSHLILMAAGETVGGSVSLPLGLLATHLGQLELAAEHLDAALAVHREMGADVLTAHTLHALARLLDARGARGDAAGAARQRADATAEAQRLGITALAAQLAADRAGDNHRPGGLTPREQAVAALVAEGRSNRDIAATLVVSERTVESHVQNILMKLGFSSRTEIATWALTTGVTTTPR